MSSSQMSPNGYGNKSKGQRLARSFSGTSTYVITFLTRMPFFSFFQSAKNVQGTTLPLLQANSSTALRYVNRICGFIRFKNVNVSIL